MAKLPADSVYSGDGWDALAGDKRLGADACRRVQTRGPKDALLLGGSSYISELLMMPRLRGRGSRAVGGRSHIWVGACRQLLADAARVSGDSGDSGDCDAGEG